MDPGSDEGFCQNDIGAEEGSKNFSTLVAVEMAFLNLMIFERWEEAGRGLIFCQVFELNQFTVEFIKIQSMIQ